MIATARNIQAAERSNPEVQALGGIWLQLDVRSENAAHTVAEAIRAAEGTIDVVVNNAGTMALTSIEDAK